MGREREITALPSLVVMPGGETRRLDQMNQQQKEAVNRQITRNIEVNMGRYYTSNPENWKQFLNAMEKGNAR